MTEPIKMYCARYWLVKIEEVEVARLTAKTACVVTKSGGLIRHHLHTENSGIFPTWEQAHAALLIRAEARLNAARLQLQRAQGEHGNIVGMERPCYNTETPTAPNPNEH